MELRNRKFELRDRKFIKNNKLLPGYSGGVPPYGESRIGYANWLDEMNNSDQLNVTQPNTVAFGNSRADYANQMAAINANSIKPAVGVSPVGISLPTLENLNQKVKAALDSGALDIKPLTKPTQAKSVSPTDYGAIVLGVADTTMKIYGSFQNDVTPEGLLLQTGQRLMHAGDIGYMAQKAADANAETKRVEKGNVSNILGATATGAGAGAMIGSVIPGLGTAIGGVIGGAIGLIGSGIGSIFRSKKSRNALRRASLMLANQNAEAKSAAWTEYLQLKRLKEQGANTYDDVYMRGYKDGKAVHTSHGSAVRKLNSWGSAGETVVDTETGDWHVLPGIPNFKDTLPMFVRGKDAVLSNHGASQYFQATRDLDGALAMDLIYRATGTNAFKNGKFPRYAEGWWNNFIPSFAGLAASAGQVIGAYNDDIKRTDVNRTNRYASSALNKLAGLKINTIPITNEILNQKAIADNNVNSTYGLSAGQKARFRSLNMFNTQRALSKLGQEAQDRLNQYIAQLANVQAAIGNQEADRATKSNMFDDEMLAKAHAARHLMTLMGIRNFIDSMQQWYANEFKRKQFNRTMNLYEQQLAIDLAKLNADIDYRKQLYKSPYAYFPVGMRAALSGGNGLWLA